MFRTEFSLPKPRFSIDIKDPLLSLGSCFANDMGQRLNEHKFNIVSNPGGILFNPLSIFELMEVALTDKVFAENTFLDQDGTFLNYKLHSEVNAGSKTELTQHIQELSKQLHARLASAKVIILTFGTAWVYKLKQDGSIVANCHKVPQSMFSKVLLSTDEITEKFAAIRDNIQVLNPEVRFITTVSPVRHVKDTLPLNSASKATLRLACHQLQERFENVDYFPSYEIMMDDLRDYRFYKQDMLHPTEQAVDYIWQKFKDSFFNQDTLNFVETWAKLKTSIEHRPFRPSSVSHQNFLQDLIVKLENLSSFADVSEELKTLKSQLV